MPPKQDPDKGKTSEVKKIVEAGAAAAELPPIKPPEKNVVLAAEKEAPKAPDISGYLSDDETRPEGTPLFPYRIHPTGVVNAGGKSTSNFGRMTRVISRELNPLVESAEKKPKRQGADRWRYVVAMNRRITDPRSLQHIINDGRRDLVTPEMLETKRFGMALGNTDLDALSDNEESAVEERARRRKARADNSESALVKLRTYDIPIIIHYLAWQANWIDRKTGEPVDIAIVRAAYLAVKAQSSVLATKMRHYERTRAHFPFGQARSLLCIHSAVFFGRSDRKTFIQSQDADYIHMREQRRFTPPGEAGPADDDVPLFARYDQAILAHEAQHGTFPLFIGGAHVYSPDEDMRYLTAQPGFAGLDLEACKAWTRFGSELGNAMKALIGRVNPKGLYFHEPNTVFSWDPSDPPRFGEDSEMQEYMRAVVARKPDCRSGPARYLFFSDALVLSTSQRRSGTPFTIRFYGQFRAGHFEGWQCADIRALQDMSQEIFTSNAWANVIATSFSDQKKSSPRKPARAQLVMTEEMKLWSPKATKPGFDARRPLAQLYNMFDPHFIAWRGARTLSQILKLARCDIQYGPAELQAVLTEEGYRTATPAGNPARQAELAIIQRELARIYTPEAAAHMVELARQTGELRRRYFSSFLGQPYAPYALRAR